MARIKSAITTKNGHQEAKSIEFDFYKSRKNRGIGLIFIESNKNVYKFNFLISNSLLYSGNEKICNL